MDALVGETVSLLESTVFPQLAQQWRNELQENEEQILPHRLPLKRRLAEFRHGAPLRRTAVGVGPASNLSASSSLPSYLTGNLWAIERFRDITPALVVAVFDEWLVLEPGDIGPLPLHHPVARELIRCVNLQILTLPLLEKLREFGAPIYDGCAVIGIVDYRRWAFSTAGGQRSPESTNRTNARTTIAPEMHKILLQSNYGTILADIDHQSLPGSLGSLVESRILMAMSPPVCLDPSPLVSRVMTALNYDRGKFTATIPMNSALVAPQAPLASTAVADSAWPEISKNVRIETFLQRCRLNTRISMQQHRFRTLTMIEEYRSQQVQVATEPLYGLDARKDPARLKLTTPPALTWLQPGTSLWRTMRFEERGEASLRHLTVQIVIHHGGGGGLPPGAGRSTPLTPGPIMLRFEVIIRMGTQPCLGDAAKPLHTVFPTKATTECFIEQFKQIMLAEGKICVADVSNPNAMAGLLRGPLAGTESAMAMAATFASIPPGNTAGMFIPANSGFAPTRSLGDANRTVRQTLVYGSPQIGGLLRPIGSGVGGMIGNVTNLGPPMQVGHSGQSTQMHHPGQPIRPPLTRPPVMHSEPQTRPSPRPRK